MRKTVNILGINVDTFTTLEALDYIAEQVRSEKSYYIVTPNPEFAMQSLNNEGFREAVNLADLALPDGVGILWASKYLSLPMVKWQPARTIQAHIQLISTGCNIIFNPRSLTSVIPERVTGADMVWELSKLASKRGWKIFLVGAAPGVATTTAERLKLLYPNLEIAGALTGPPYDDEATVIEKIKETQPEIVFLAFPAKEQLRWMQTYTPKLNGVIMMGIGGALDFIASGVALNAPETSKQPARRAPDWLQERGLEWLWRYLTQPWRRKRIYAATIGFIREVLKYKLTDRD